MAPSNSSRSPNTASNRFNFICRKADLAKSAEDKIKAADFQSPKTSLVEKPKEGNQFLFFPENAIQRKYEESKKQFEGFLRELLQAHSNDNLLFTNNPYSKNQLNLESLIPNIPRSILSGFGSSPGIHPMQMIQIGRVDRNQQPEGDEPSNEQLTDKFKTKFKEEKYGQTKF